MSRMPERPHVTDTGKVACHEFRGIGGGKGWRDGGMRVLVPPPSPIVLRCKQRVGSGMGLFVGLEVAAEGRVLCLDVVVALFQLLDRGDHRPEGQRDKIEDLPISCFFATVQ